MDQGLVNGINAGKGSVQNAAKSVASGVVTTIKSNLNEQKFYSYGYHVSDGLASGILAGKSMVIQAAASVAQAAVETAKKKAGDQFAIQGIPKNWSRNHGRIYHGNPG